LLDNSNVIPSCTFVVHAFVKESCEWIGVWLNIVTFQLVGTCYVIVGIHFMCQEKMHRLESFEDSRGGSNLRVHLVSNMELLLWDLDSKRFYRS
jgi:hypothetical protein